MTAESNPWNDVLGPFYDDAGLERRGIDTQGLIGLTTGDGSVVYPHGQFEEVDGEIRRSREDVIRLWQTLIAPEIELGVVDQWTATGLLLQSTPERPSQAELLASGDLTLEALELEIKRDIWALKQ